VKLTRALGSLLVVLSLTVSLYPRDQTTNQAVLNQARSAYYSLARKGFKGFTATVEPNWEVVLAETATPANLKIFRDVRFSIVVDADGAATVTHELSPNASKPDLQPAVNRIHSHVQSLVMGFFNTWRSFAVGSPFPENENQIKNSGKQYLASYTIQSADVTVTMDADFSVRELTVSTPIRKQTVKPQFQKTGDGFLLTDYKHIYEPVGEGIKTTLDFHIDHQDVDGMKLPQKVRINGIRGSEPVAAELVFVLKRLCPKSSFC
jgi:hypothetical protein